MRWRSDGRLMCAAMTDEEVGDTYIDDRLHYQLTVISRAVIADPQHEQNALWHWVHDDADNPNSGFLRAVPEREHLAGV
jgi:hypothetical protein